MHIRPCAASLCLALVLASAPALAEQGAELTAVPAVNLQNYLGQWYEIARLPRFFQRHCVSDTVALYRARTDKAIDVVNTCRTKDGDIQQVRGLAEPVAGSGNAKLEVTILPPFSVDYWIIGLAPDYSWSVVGSPSRKSLWILARTPTLPPTELEKAKAIARDKGFAVEDLLYTPHSAAAAAIH
jgi:apolipoprotein D and lipocalin family protein